MSPMKGYNFTERTRRVLALSRAAAASLGQDRVDTEHFLLGIVREGEGVGATMLRNLLGGAGDLEEKILAGAIKVPSAGADPDLPYTSSAKRVLELAMMEAGDLGHSYVGTEHLLLGLAREERGLAARILSGAGLTPPALRAEMIRILGP
jgi:ATP-dependent Clp protease ATP-binding subunit ClpC